MKKNKINSISIYYKEENSTASDWGEKIKNLIREEYPKIKIKKIEKGLCSEKEKPDIIFVLGGDGTIIEVARNFSQCDSIVMGLNLGNIGFMASVRNSEEFISGIKKVLKNEFRVDERTKISAEILRNGDKIAEFEAINEITVQHLFGIVNLRVDIENHPFQYIRGNGVILSTASGSTAYNMSAHGPIIMPEIDCFVVTEIMDHNIPTPSVVLKGSSNVSIYVEEFRTSKKFTFSNTQKPADVVLVADGAETFPIEKGDEIKIKKSLKTVKFAEIEKNYFLKSLKEKFAFK